MERLDRIERLGRPAWAACLVLILTAAAALGQTTAPATAPKPPAAEKDGPAVALTRPGTFEIHVQGADLRGVLQLLSTQGKRNIIATKEVQGSVTADLYGVTFEQALHAVLSSSGFDYLDEDGFIHVYTAEQKQAALKSKIEPVVRVLRLSYISAADAQAMLAPALTEGGAIAVNPAAAVGITSSKTEAGGNAYANCDLIVVRDAPKTVEKIEAMLKELDVKPDQVLVETTILSAQLREGNRLGINFNTLGGVDFQDAGYTWNASGQPSYAAKPITEAQRSGVNFRTDFSPVSGGMTFGIFGSDAAFFITALETVTDVTVLANPKLLVMNKQRGEVMVGRRDGYLTTTLTETSATQTVEFLETGTRLLVRPYITRDDHIRMEIHPEDSDGSVENSLPSETTTEVTTNVMVRDGHTIVIGGLFRENTKNGRSQIPLVGNIPYLGTLFRTTDDGTERDEVIILITPHIIRSPKDDAVSEQLKDDAERLRMGQRQGLSWWANERLSENHLRWAKEALRQGDREKALWNLDMALSMRPRMIEAIQLKEQLTQKAYWADHARNSHVKYVIQRMVMHELGKPVDPIIPPDKPLHTQDISEDARKALGIEPRYLPGLPGEEAAPWPATTQPAAAPAAPAAPSAKPPTTQPAGQAAAEPTPSQPTHPEAAEMMTEDDAAAEEMTPEEAEAMDEVPSEPISGE